MLSFHTRPEREREREREREGGREGGGEGRIDRNCETEMKVKVGISSMCLFVLKVRTGKTR